MALHTRRSVLPIVTHLVYGLFYAYAAYFCILYANGRESQIALRIGTAIQTFMMYAYVHLGLPYRRSECMIRHKKLLLPGVFGIMLIVVALPFLIRTPQHPMMAFGLALAAGYVFLVGLHTRSFLDAAWPARR